MVSQSVAFAAMPDLDDDGVVAKFAIHYRGRTVIVNVADVSAVEHADLNNTLLATAARCEEPAPSACRATVAQRVAQAVLSCRPTPLALAASSASMFTLTACGGTPSLG